MRCHPNMHGHQISYTYAMDNTVALWVSVKTGFKNCDIGFMGSMLKLMDLILRINK